MSATTPHSPPKSGFSARGGTARSIYLQPAFVAAVAVLGLAALGLNATTQALQVHFKKLPVPLRVKLDDAANGVAPTFGNWRKVTEQVSLNPDLQHELGTDQFVFRQYADTNKVPKDRLDDLQAQSDEKQQQLLLRRIMEEYPNSVVTFNVTYYTGLADRVTHVPDVCMVAGGYRADSYKVVNDKEGATFKLLEGGERYVPFRFINFEDETGRGQVPTRGVYFFNCNGSYEESPQAVRAKLQDLRERYGYYAKVELMINDFQMMGRSVTEDSEDPAAKRSLEQMKDLIAAALPEIERCLPDWSAVKAGKPSSPPPARSITSTPLLAPPTAPPPTTQRVAIPSVLPAGAPAK